MVFFALRVSPLGRFPPGVVSMSIIHFPPSPDVFLIATRVLMHCSIPPFLPSPFPDVCCSLRSLTVFTSFAAVAG